MAVTVLRFSCLLFARFASLLTVVTALPACQRTSAWVMVTRGDQSHTCCIFVTASLPWVRCASSSSAPPHRVRAYKEQVPHIANHGRLLDTLIKTWISVYHDHTVMFLLSFLYSFSDWILTSSKYLILSTRYQNLHCVDFNRKREANPSLAHLSVPVEIFPCQWIYLHVVRLVSVPLRWKLRDGASI